MEAWILYYDRTYEALPWRFREAWADVVRGDFALPDACEDFGLVSPTDSSTEVPSVPPDLPRGVPKGRYRLGVYHDPENLYVLVDLVEGPTVVTSEMMERQTQVSRDSTILASLMILTADEGALCRFSRDVDGQARFSVGPARHGPRRLPVPELAPDWQYEMCARADGARMGWRIARSSLAAAFDGTRLRLSVSCVCFRSHEYVAWGSGGIWGPRPDEMGTVCLVTERTAPPCPECRRLELLYDPQRETGRFRLFWRDLYGADEALPGESLTPWSPYRDLCSFRLNGRQQSLVLAPVVETDELPIPDGHNFVEASTAGELSTRIYLEKRSGNRVAPCPYTGHVETPREELVARMRGELDACYARLQQRLRRGEPFDLGEWPLYHAASAGRVHAWLDPDPRLLEILRAVADEALTLQRDDGTFGGFHLAKARRRAGEAPRWSGGAYDTGQAGELWAVAAWRLGDAKYLAASERLLAAYEQYRIEFNQNYAAFTLFHLSTHYRLTRDPQALEYGLYYAKHLAAAKILPLGYQAGHNFYTCYGFITLRGLANFCQVLPEHEPYRAELRELCVRMLNQLITRLQPDGSFDARDRYQLGLRLWVSGVFSMAFLVKGEDLRRLDDTLQLVLQAPDTARRFGLLESEVARYLACRDDLLRGEAVDPLAFV